MSWVTAVTSHLNPSKLFMLHKNPWLSEYVGVPAVIGKRLCANRINLFY